MVSRMNTWCAAAGLPLIPQSQTAAEFQAAVNLSSATGGTGEAGQKKKQNKSKRDSAAGAGGSSKKKTLGRSFAQQALQLTGADAIGGAGARSGRSSGAGSGAPLDALDKLSRDTARAEKSAATKKRRREEALAKEKEEAEARGETWVPPVKQRGKSKGAEGANKRQKKGNDAASAGQSAAAPAAASSSSSAAAAVAAASGGQAVPASLSLSNLGTPSSGRLPVPVTQSGFPLGHEHALALAFKSTGPAKSKNGSAAAAAAAHSSANDDDEDEEYVHDDEDASMHSDEHSDD